MAECSLASTCSPPNLAPPRPTSAAANGVVVDRIDLWQVDLRDLSQRCDGQLSACLSAEEVVQANRYLRAVTGQQFRLTRGALRHILAEYLKMPPAQVPIIRQPMGKPVLDSGAGLPALHFNVTHSDAHAVVALCSAREVGVDVETRRRSLDVMGLAERFFAPEEALELGETSENDRLEAFLRFWTRKEALLKGQGRGLSQDWTDVRVGTLRRGPVTIPAADLSMLWQILDLELTTHHVGAVAVAGTAPFCLQWHEAKLLF